MCQINCHFDASTISILNITSKNVVTLQHRRGDTVWPHNIGHVFKAASFIQLSAVCILLGLRGKIVKAVTTGMFINHT